MKKKPSEAMEEFEMEDRIESPTFEEFDVTPSWQTAVLNSRPFDGLHKFLQPTQKLSDLEATSNSIEFALEKQKSMSEKKKVRNIPI